MYTIVGQQLLTVKKNPSQVFVYNGTTFNLFFLYIFYGKIAFYII